MVNKMIFQKLIVVLLIVLVGCGISEQAKSKKKSNEDKQAEADQARLDEFFDKYCVETDEKMLAKLEKCEEIQPENMKQIEMDCVKKILKKTENPTYQEIKMVECKEELELKVDQCEHDKMKNMTITDADKVKMGEIAKKIMHCGFDCYGIKHD